MKFEINKRAHGDKCAYDEPQSGRLSYEAAKKKKTLEEEDMDFEEAFDDDIDTEKLLEQFDDDIDEMGYDDLDLDEFDEDLNDDDLDVFDDDFGAGKPSRKRKRDDDDIDDDDVDDSQFYNDEFKDFDNYTIVSDFDDDLDTYIQNEDAGGYFDYDDRY